MGGIPMTPNLLAALMQTTGQQTPNMTGQAPPPYLLKAISQGAGTGFGNPQQQQGQNVAQLAGMGL
jgi:hypothetical protein